jgi:hypothetical protein
MEFELRARLNPNNKSYMKGIKYFEKQIEVAKRILKGRKP